MLSNGTASRAVIRLMDFIAGGELGMAPKKGRLSRRVVLASEGGLRFGMECLSNSVGDLACVVETGKVV